MLSDSLKAKLRRRLEKLSRRLSERGELLRQQALERPMTDSVGELSSYDQHASDLGSETFERSKDLGLLERLRITEDEVRQALSRLDQGRYGYCEECGRFIGVGRLLAVPYARRCRECQEVHDLEEERRVENRTAGRRPLEEASLMAPFGRANERDRGEAGLGPGDMWQALARYGNANSPQDVPGAVDYDETWEGADTEDPGGVSEVESVPDVTGQGVVSPDVVYPDPSGPGRRRQRPAGGPEKEAPGEEGDRWGW